MIERLVVNVFGLCRADNKCAPPEDRATDTIYFVPIRARDHPRYYTGSQASNDDCYSLGPGPLSEGLAFEQGCGIELHQLPLVLVEV